MMYVRAIRTAPLVGCVVWLGMAPALAQARRSKTTSRSSCRRARAAPPRACAISSASIKQRIVKVTGQVLPFTKCEKWSVPKANLEAVKKEAAKRGVVVTELGADWNHIMRSAPADTKLNDKQKAMIELAKAGQGDRGRQADGGPPPAVLEHALMKDAKDPAAAKDAGEDHRRAQRQHHQDDRPHQRRHQARHVHLARHGRGDRGARHADVVAERADGRHGAGAGPHLFDPAHGRPDLRHDRDGRRADAAGACADAGPPALRRPQRARRSAGQPGRCEPAAARDRGHARARGSARRKKTPPAAGGRAAGRRRRAAGHRHRRDRRLHQEGSGQLHRHQARAHRPRHRGGQRVVPHERPRQHQAAGSSTPIRPTTSRRARTSITSGASPTRATATWRRSTACATSTAPTSPC